LFSVESLLFVHSVVKHVDIYAVIYANVFLVMCVCVLYRVDSEGWKEFITKPSLPYALRLLAGLCNGHEPTQVCVIESVNYGYYALNIIDAWQY